MTTRSSLIAEAIRRDPEFDASGKSTAYLSGYLLHVDDSDPADASAPMFKIDDRVKALVNHMPGMKGMTGIVSIARAGAPPYYGVKFDGETEIHKWLAEDELSPSDSRPMK